MEQREKVTRPPIGKPPLSRGSSRSGVSRSGRQRRSGLGSRNSARSAVSSTSSARSKLSSLRASNQAKVKQVLSGNMSGKWSTTKTNPLKKIKNVFGEQRSALHSTRTRLCINALKNGCIDAFQEIFELAHREPVLVDDVSETYFDIPDEKLNQLNALFVEAEQKRREGEFETVYDIYRKIADYFESEKDIDTSLYFHKKGQSIAKLSASLALEARAYENLGKVYERLGQLEKAMKCHEAQLALTDHQDDDLYSTNASKQLVAIYLRLANEQMDNPENGAKFLEKAFKTAEQSSDMATLHHTSYELGKIYNDLNDIESAIKYQRLFLAISQANNDSLNTARGLQYLGMLQEKQKDLEGALNTYDQFYSSADESGDQRLLGTACVKIGTLLNRMGRYTDSVAYFQQHYELAQMNGESTWLNTAKIQLGFARGDAKMRGFIKLVQEENMSSLLRWKESREAEFKEEDEPELYTPPEDFSEAITMTEDARSLLEKHGFTESPIESDDGHDGDDPSAAYDYNAAIESRTIANFENQYDDAEYAGELDDDEEEGEISAEYIDRLRSMHERNMQEANGEDIGSDEYQGEDETIADDDQENGEDQYEDDEEVGEIGYEEGEAYEQLGETLEENDQEGEVVVEYEEELGESQEE